MKLNFLIILLGIATVIAACNSRNNIVYEQINQSDSVAINFFKGDGTMDTVVTVRIVRDSSTIAALADYVTAGNSEMQHTCGYDGSIHFFKNNTVVRDIYFSNADSCRLFFFTDRGKRVGTTLPVAAAALIQSIRDK